MLKKSFVLFLLGCLLCLGGCETCKGFIGGAAEGTSQGVKKDWATLNRMDAWMRENMW
jgi:hypothetical protein